MVSSHPLLSSSPPLLRQDYKRIFFCLLAGHPSRSIFLYLSPSRAPCYLSFLHPAWWGFFFLKKTVRRGGFQHFINPCPCCLICYPFRFYGVPSFYVGRLRPDPWRPLGAGGNSSCSFLNSYSMCGSGPLGAYMAL